MAGNILTCCYMRTYHVTDTRFVPLNNFIALAVVCKGLMPERITAFIQNVSHSGTRYLQPRDYPSAALYT